MYECKQVVDLYQLLRSEASNQRQLKQLWIIEWKPSRCRSRIGSRRGPASEALEAFGFLMLKYSFSHILETLFLLFLTSILTPKVDKNRALEFTSINLRHSYILHLFLGGLSLHLNTL